MSTGAFLPLLLSFTIAAVTSQAAGVMYNTSDSRPGRSKRAANCPAKFRIYPGHTACLGVSGVSYLTKEEKKAIVDAHNKYRALADPPASNMLLLKWDDEVAMVAQKLANKCVFDHDKERGIPGRFGAGQNLGLGMKSFEGAVKAWYDEVKNFRYAEGSINDKVVGHFTQVMWATTSLIGCGVQTCDGSKMYVCNYAPPGNYQMKKPWKSGTPCAECREHCVNSRLCDCERTCLNSGDLNLTDCTCKCKYDHTQQPDCSLNCTEAKDVWWCSKKDAVKCGFSSVQCPNKCKICPSAGVGYKGTGKGTSMPKAASPHLVSLAVLIIIWTNMQHHVVP